MEALKITLTCIGLAIAYGILHDLVTAHLCIEYFTVGHPPIVNTTNPIVMALVWGVVATWWVGLTLGLLLALASRVGTRPKLALQSLWPLLLKLLSAMALGALVAGIIGYVLARYEAIYLVNGLADQISPERHRLFLSAGWAHGASYGIGLVGGLILTIRLLKKRKRLQLGEITN